MLLFCCYFQKFWINKNRGLKIITRTDDSIFSFLIFWNCQFLIVFNFSELSVLFFRNCVLHHFLIFRIFQFSMVLRLIIYSQDMMRFAIDKKIARTRGKSIYLEWRRRGRHCQHRSQGIEENRMIRNGIKTLEHPGVKAPGTAKMIIFFPAASLARLTLVPGEFSQRSIAGRLSPSCGY